VRTMLLSLAAVVAACGPVVPPYLTNARITPDLLYAGDVATCDGMGWHSEHGFEDESRIAWSVNGQTVGFDAELDFEIRGGDTVTCTVTPFDGEISGFPVSTTMLVQNTEPALAEVRITPQVPVAGDPLTCTAIGFSDPDDDLDLTQVGWMRDGVGFGTVSSVGAAAVLFPGPVEAGHSYQCIATPFDGETLGETVYAVVYVPVP